MLTEFTYGIIYYIIISGNYDYYLFMIEFLNIKNQNIVNNVYSTL